VDRVEQRSIRRNSDSPSSCDRASCLSDSAVTIARGPRESPSPRQQCRCGEKGSGRTGESSPKLLHRASRVDAARAKRVTVIDANGQAVILRHVASRIQETRKRDSRN
jgi:hypothetical protein